MPTSLTDIARQLELSPSTVSKALNGYRDVSSDTRELVLRAALELGYQPSSAARDLPRGRTDRIGLFLNTALEYVVDYLSGIIPGAVRCSQACGKRLLIYTLTDNDPDQLLQVCRAGEIDGVILFSTHYDSHTIETLLEDNFPFVVMGRHIPDERVSCVVPDYYDGTRQIMDHLLGQGHRRIAFMTRPELTTANEARLQGYLDALAAADLASDGQLIVETRLEADSGVAPTRQLLVLASPPTAIVAAHDLVAVDVINTLQAAGLRVPQDVAVTGFDGLRAGFRTLPHISTVQQPLERIGERVVELVNRQLNDPAALPVQETLPVQLVLRGSA
ncbi:MAG: LacI family DNA-binding transcriptional regulator [Anaerolineae bacterium]|nr:LacI family DNA-binding transcriptional regulator [Anaerolineae bacterium]